jgi:hypothetical protein
MVVAPLSLVLRLACPAELAKRRWDLKSANVAFN